MHTRNAPSWPLDPHRLRQPRAIVMLSAAGLAWSLACAAIAAPTKPASSKQVSLKQVSLKQDAVNRAALRSAVLASGAATLDIFSPWSTGRTEAMRFEIENPDAQESAATLIEPSPDPKAVGGEQRTPGYSAWSRVVVRANDPKLAEAAAAQLGLKLEPAHPELPMLADTRLYACASVREAATLAAAVRAQPGVREAFVDMRLPIADRTVPADPLVSQQWHLVNTITPVADLNVEGAWKAGYTGAGRTVCVLEGGWNINHPDLAAKYHLAASQTTSTSYGSHGTSCAGLAGAAPNNTLGGTGVAYDAQLSRCYYGSSSTTASAFLFRNDLNDIKTNSWGPTDNGRLWTMSSVEFDAINEGHTLGRGGLGTIYVWAGGNGRTANDRTDYDPYASNRRVICIGAVDDEDNVSTFSEPGASLLIVTPSRRLPGGSGDRGIVTTTGETGYTTTFGGTSAAAPIGAGAIALMLDANPALTVRDVQHVLVNSARKCDPLDAGWSLNGAGRWINYDYGFGAFDATAACAMAATWTNVPPVASLTYSTPNSPFAIPDDAPAWAGGGASWPQLVQRRMRVEHAEVVVYAPHAIVGQLRVWLTSADGTESLFAAPRNDTTVGQYQNYVFTTVRSWDEFANGVWTLNIADEGAGTTGTFNSWTLRLFGTLPECPADWSMDGSVGVDDLFLHLDDWFAGIADVDADGDTDVSDLFFFLDEWFGSGPGC